VALGAHRFHLGGRGGVVGADGGGHLGEVAAAIGRYHRGDLRAHLGVDGREHPVGDLEAPLGQLGAQVLVEAGDAVVVEARRDRAEHRQVGQVHVELLAVAGQLPPDVTQGVLGPAALVLVDHHRLGEVEHVDLLELAGRPELRRHHVDRDVDVVDDAGVALADAGRLHDHEVEAGGSAGGDDVVERLGHLGLPPGGQRPEHHLGRVDRVHADAVAEQGAAAPPAGGVDGEHRDAELVLLVEAEPAHQLVGER
jgi:hypothetical protein